MGHIVAMDDSEAQMRLTVSSREEWESLASDLSPDCEDLRSGTLWVAADAEEMAAVEKKHAYYASFGVRTEILGEAELRRHEPDLRPGLAGALRVPGDRVVYATNCARWLLRGIDARSGVSVAALEGTTARVAGGDEYRASAVILACGAESSKLIPEIPIDPRKGHLCITDRYAGFIRHQIVELGYLKSAHKFAKESVAFNVQPRPNGQVLIGSSREFAGWDDSINHKLLGEMLARACAYMPGLSRLSLIRAWVGFRPATKDKLPLIGAWPGYPGVFIAAGHEGLGITTSLGTARLLAAEILGTPPPFDPAPYRAARVLEPGFGTHHE
jgi:glycine/D-amino acid oxidase-like deaminating enzyme